MEGRRNRERSIQNDDDDDDDDSMRNNSPTKYSNVGNEDAMHGQYGHCDNDHDDDDDNCMRAGGSAARRKQIIKVLH